MIIESMNQGTLKRVIYAYSESSKCFLTISIAPIINMINESVSKYYIKLSERKLDFNDFLDVLGLEFCKARWRILEEEAKDFGIKGGGFWKKPGGGFWNEIGVGNLDWELDYCFLAEREVVFAC